MAIGVVMTGAAGGVVSILTSFEVQPLEFPTLSTVRASTATPVASAGMSAPASVTDHAPDASDVTVLAAPLPILTSILLEIGPVPTTIMPVVFSPAVITLSPAIGVVITGAESEDASTVTERDAAALTLPAASVWVALIVAFPELLISAPANVADHTPAPLAVTVLVDVVPQATVTVAFDAAVPVTDTPAARSVMLTIPSPAIGAFIVGTATVVST